MLPRQELAPAFVYPSNPPRLSNLNFEAVVCFGAILGGRADSVRVARFT